MAAAITLASERGMATTTMTAIARAAGVTSSHLFWAYGDKDSLFAEALDWAYGQASAAQGLWQVSAADPPDDRASAAGVEDLLVERLRGTRQLPVAADYWRLGVLLLEGQGEQYALAGARYRALRERSLEVLGRWWSVRRAPDAPRMAALTLAVLDGMAVRRRIAGTGPAAGEELVRQVARTLVEAAHDSTSIPFPGVHPVRPRARVESEAGGAPTDAGGSAGRILDVTIAALVELGVEGTTVAKISERSNLPPTSLYWHFRDKSELLRSALGVLQENWLTAADRARSSGPSRSILAVALAAEQEEPRLLALERAFLLRREAHESVAEHALEQRASRLAWLGQATAADAEVSATDTAAVASGGTPAAVAELLLDGLGIRRSVDASSETSTTDTAGAVLL